MAEWQVTAGVELILGGQKSGKSRRAELLAASWLAGGGEGGEGSEGQPPRQATLIATAQAWDDEMRQRIARHQADRAQRVPGLATLEEPLHLAEAITRLSTPQHLLVVDCLTLWLTGLLMPMVPHAAAEPLVSGASEGDAAAGGSGSFEQNVPLALDVNGFAATQIQSILHALRTAPGPVVLVGNEIGLGVIPMGAEVRAFVDALGVLNQRVAAHAQRVVLMVAGQALVIKQEQ